MVGAWQGIMETTTIKIRVFHGRAARGLARTSRSPKPAGPFNSGLGLNKFGIFYYIRCRKQVLFHVYEYEITTIFSKPNI